LGILGLQAISFRSELHDDAPLPRVAHNRGALDAHGCVRVPGAPGLGREAVWDDIRGNAIPDGRG